MKTIDIVFDGPPAHESGRFIEVEDDAGNSISIGEWVARNDGYWALRIPDYREVQALFNELAAGVDDLWKNTRDSSSVKRRQS